MKFNFALPLVFICCLLIGSTSQADIMALYEFDNPSTDVSGNDFDIDSENNVDIAASTYNTRTAVTNNGIASSAADQHGFARSMNTNNSYSMATNDNYHEFSVQTVNGIWSIDSIHFEYWVNDTTANQDVFEATVYTDLLGYNVGDEIGTYSYVRQTSQIPEIHNVTFNGLQFQPQFQNLATGTVATFRILFSDNQDNPMLVHRVDDVELRGFRTTGVPEPNSLVIMGLLAGVATLRRRKR